MFFASMVLPTPFGPATTTLPASCIKSSDIRASIAPRSHFFGHFQSKSHTFLYRPICAFWMRLSRLRWVRPSSSHCTTCSTQSHWATSCQCASKPCRCKASARWRRDSSLFIVVLLYRKLIVAVEPVGRDRFVAFAHMLGQQHRHGWRQVPFFAPSLQGKAHGVRVGRIASHRF